MVSASTGGGQTPRSIALPPVPGSTALAPSWPDITVSLPFVPLTTSLSPARGHWPHSQARKSAQAMARPEATHTAHKPRCRAFTSAHNPSRWPTELADGLALKSLRLPRLGVRFAPTTRFSRSPTRRQRLGEVGKPTGVQRRRTHPLLIYPQIAALSWVGVTGY